MNLLPAVLAALLLALPGVAAAGGGGMAIEVLPLRHRLARDVIPIIEPLVAPGGTVTGTNDQLIVKTTAANLAEIQAILDRIDRAPRRLRISVRQNLGGSAESGEETLAAGAGTGGDAFVRYGVTSTRGRGDEASSYFVQTLEGSPAWIATGQAVPLPRQDVYVGPGGVTVSEGVEYRDVSSGFYAVPRLNGDRVTLDLYPRLHRMQPDQTGVIATQEEQGQVAGRLGEWMAVGGGADRDFDGRTNTGTASTRRRGVETYGVWVRVDEVP